MTKSQNSKYYDLEQRTLAFAQMVRLFVKKLPRHTANFEDSKQLIRSSGSTGANYIEANESLSRKDFLVRIRISRKESKESSYWLNLVDVGSDERLKEEKKRLLQEAEELKMILSAILTKVDKPIPV